MTEIMGKPLVWVAAGAVLFVLSRFSWSGLWQKIRSASTAAPGTNEGQAAVLEAVQNYCHLKQHCAASPEAQKALQDFWKFLEPRIVKD